MTKRNSTRRPSVKRRNAKRFSAERFSAKRPSAWIFTAAALAFSSLTTLAMAQAPATPASPPAAAGATQTLPSGVAIRHTTVGAGQSPTAGDTVKVHYRGTLADGKEFDSSYKRGQPAVFPLARVVPCWTQGVQTLKVGGKATLTCPPATAYGARGVPNAIPPDSTLTFEIELLSIERP